MLMPTLRLIGLLPQVVHKCVVFVIIAVVIVVIIVVVVVVQQSIENYPT